MQNEKNQFLKKKFKITFTINRNDFQLEDSRKSSGIEARSHS